MSKLERRRLNLNDVESFTREDIVNLYEGDYCKKTMLNEVDVDYSHEDSDDHVFEVGNSGIFYRGSVYYNVKHTNDTVYDEELVEVFPREKCIIVYE